PHLLGNGLDSEGVRQGHRISLCDVPVSLVYLRDVLYLPTHRPVAGIQVPEYYEPAAGATYRQYATQCRELIGIIFATPGSKIPSPARPPLLLLCKIPPAWARTTPYPGAYASTLTTTAA